MPYEVVIGLEVHAQLLTASKLFCGCSTAFGAAANTQTCPVCLGMPGVLPVINGKAVEFSDFMLALFVGVIATPLAPVVKDISSAIGTAVSALKSVKG